MGTATGPRLTHAGHVLVGRNHLEQWLGLQFAMGPDHLVVVITMCNFNADPQRHRGYLAIYEAAYGVTATTTPPVNRGCIFCVAHRGKRFDVESLQESPPQGCFGFVSRTDQQLHHHHLRHYYPCVCGDAICQPATGE